jgi:hypothetical protein
MSTFDPSATFGFTCGRRESLMRARLSWAHELSGHLLSTPRLATETIVRRNALFLIAGGNTAARAIFGR